MKKHDQRDEQYDVQHRCRRLVWFSFADWLYLHVDMIHKVQELQKRRYPCTKPSSLHSCRPCATGGWTFAIGTLSNEMQLQDLACRALFESEFCHGSQQVPNMHRHHHTGVVKDEQWVLPQTDMGYYSELLTTLQRNISIENIVKTIPVVTIYNLVLNADFLTVVRPSVYVRYRKRHVTRRTLRRRYEDKNYRIKKPLRVLVELAKPIFII